MVHPQSVNSFSESKTQLLHTTQRYKLPRCVKCVIACLNLSNRRFGANSTMPDEDTPENYNFSGRVTLHSNTFTKEQILLVQSVVQAIFALTYYVLKNIVTWNMLCCIQM